LPACSEELWPVFLHIIIILPTLEDEIENKIRKHQPNIMSSTDETFELFFASRQLSIRRGRQSHSIGIAKILKQIELEDLGRGKTETAGV
jgi:hypothetical protein